MFNILRFIEEALITFDLVNFRSGDISALKNSVPCPQPDFYDEKKIIGDEDCLALNIFTPQMPDETTGLPVLIWIHGGGLNFSCTSKLYSKVFDCNRISLWECGAIRR